MGSLSICFQFFAHFVLVSNLLYFIFSLHNIFIILSANCSKGGGFLYENFQLGDIVWL